MTNYFKFPTVTCEVPTKGGLPPTLGTTDLMNQQYTVLSFGTYLEYVELSLHPKTLHQSTPGGVCSSLGGAVVSHLKSCGFNSRLSQFIQHPQVDDSACGVKHCVSSPGAEEPHMNPNHFPGDFVFFCLLPFKQKAKMNVFHLSSLFYQKISPVTH